MENTEKRYKVTVAVSLHEVESYTERPVSSFKLEKIVTDGLYSAQITTTGFINQVKDEFAAVYQREIEKQVQENRLKQVTS